MLKLSWSGDRKTWGEWPKKMLKWKTVVGTAFSNSSSNGSIISHDKITHSAWQIKRIAVSDDTNGGEAHKINNKRKMNKVVNAIRKIDEPFQCCHFVVVVLSGGYILFRLKFCFYHNVYFQLTIIEKKANRRVRSKIHIPYLSMNYTFNLLYLISDASQV